MSFVLKMDKCYTEDQVDLFHYPARILVAGFSNSGKSELVTKIVEKYHGKFTHIIVCGVSQHPLQKIEAIKNKLNVYQNIIDPLSEVEEGEKSSILFILDDIFLEAAESKVVANAFIKGRHNSLSVIMVTQNVYFQGKYARTISLNCTHYILLRMRDLNQIECLSRQIHGSSLSKKFVEVYKTAVLQKPFTYLLVDLSINTHEDLHLRSLIANEASCEVVYLKWKD